MRVVDHRIAEPACLGLRLVERFAGLHGQPIGIDHRIQRSGCFVDCRLDSSDYQGQRWCRMACAAVAGGGADAASRSEIRLPKRRGRGPRTAKRSDATPERFSDASVRGATSRWTSSWPIARHRRRARRCRCPGLLPARSRAPCRPSRRRSGHTGGARSRAADH